MRTTITALIDGRRPGEVFDQVDSLDNYPAWLRLVHRVEPDETDAGRPAWHVELRARVGPFTRSKRLRMVRTVFEPERHVRFERVQDDDRDHAEWILEATVPDDTPPARSSRCISSTRETCGRSPLLHRILDDEVPRGKHALREVIAPAPRR